MKVSNITKKYGNKMVIDNFSYDFADGKITVVLGESGVGKTTLMNILSGVDKGEYSVEKKSVSVVFQNDRLLPNLTVEKNLKLVNPSMNVDKCLEDFDLKGTNQMYPNNLSAGMSRRVAIIRALSYDSEVLIMDEPFRNLDYYVKYKIMDIIKAIHKDKKNTIIMVTHDISEAVYMADEIIMLEENGKITVKFDNIDKTTEQKILNKFLKK